jgi:HEAT repeat protein
MDLLRDAADFAERARAAHVLGDFVDAETTAALTRALRDSSSEVAVQAAESLARHGGAVAITALQGVLQNSDGYVGTETRASAVRALGSLLPPNEGTAVVAAVADADATVSLAAIAALAERDEPVSANALLGVLEDRGAFYLPLTRHAAARALSRLRRYDPPRVRALLDQEADPAVRAALESLAS